VRTPLKRCLRSFLPSVRPSVSSFPAAARAQVNKQRERAQIAEWARKRQPPPHLLAQTMPSGLAPLRQNSSSSLHGGTQPAAGHAGGLGGAARKPNSAGGPGGAGRSGTGRIGSAGSAAPGEGTMVYVIGQS
jgi:hypothetical protein